MQLSPLGKITLAAACGGTAAGEALHKKVRGDILPVEQYGLALEVLKAAIAQSGDDFFLRACRILGRQIRRAQTEPPNSQEKR